MSDAPKRLRGFAAMTPEKRSAISRKGGLAVPPENRQYSRDRELASVSGRRGAATRNARRREGES